MIVGTKYDKELKEKVFYVREVDSYTHKTTTTLTVDWVDGVFTLTAVVGNLIGKGFVKFYRDGVEVGEQYVSKTATLLLQSETNTGVFVAKFMGNSDCLKSQSSEVSYSPLPVPEFSLTVDKDTGVVGDTLTFTPHLSDGVTGSIMYTVDGAEYTKNIGETFTYKFNKSGNFTVSAVYSGDETHQGATASVLVTISKINLVFTCSASSTNVYVGETVTLTATVKSDGVNVNEGQVDFGDGVLVDVSNGTAVKTFTKTTPTVLTVTPSYKGTSTYTAATASSLIITWIEEPVTPEITISADTLIGEGGDDLPITLSSNLKNTALTVLLNDVEVADSVTTDNTGNAVFNYNCNGAGDVNVKVKYLSGTNIYYSNILQVEDCIKYGFKDSDTWINPTGHSATNNVVDGVFTSTSNSSKGDSILQLDITGDFIITYDAQWQTSTRCGVGAKDTSRTKHFDSGTDSNFKTQKYIYWSGSNETETHYSESTQTTYCPCKIIKSDGHLKGYMNDTLVCDLSYPWISQCTVWNFHTTIWNSSTIKIKNLKIKSK